MPKPSPDFVIVGAPRAGTTSLYRYLQRHPAVFMPANKEPHYFGSDLTRQHAPIRACEYQELFRGRRPGQITGEASPLYLMSACAPSEIAAHRRDTRVIAMLRNPVDVMSSLHRQNLAMGVEDVSDFGAALELEPRRARGEALPARTRAIDALRYREVGKLGDQVARLHATFPREQIHTTFFEDVQDDAALTFARVAVFLGVEPRMDADSNNHNAGGSPRWWRLQHWITHPTPPFDRLAEQLRRYTVAHRFRQLVVDLNRRPSQPAPIDPDLRRQLTVEYTPQVKALESFTGRDLSTWLSSARSSAVTSIGIA